MWVVAGLHGWVRGLLGGGPALPLAALFLPLALGLGRSLRFSLGLFCPRFGLLGFGLGLLADSLQRLLLFSLGAPLDLLDGLALFVSLCGSN